jgi:hypothetical protein
MTIANSDSTQVIWTYERNSSSRLMRLRSGTDDLVLPQSALCALHLTHLSGGVVRPAS